MISLGVINDLPNSASYDNFAYHVELLKEFAPKSSTGQKTSNGTSGGTSAAANSRNQQLQKGVSVSHVPSSNKRYAGSMTGDDEDNFNIAISIHGKVPTNRGAGMSRAKSCAVGI